MALFLTAILLVAPAAVWAAEGRPGGYGADDAAAGAGEESCSTSGEGCEAHRSRIDQYRQQVYQPLSAITLAHARALAQAYLQADALGARADRKLAEIIRQLPPGPVRQDMIDYRESAREELLDRLRRGAEALGAGIAAVAAYQPCAGGGLRRVQDAYELIEQGTQLVFNSQQAVVGLYRALGLDPAAGVPQPDTDGGQVLADWTALSRLLGRAVDTPDPGLRATARAEAALTRRLHDSYREDFRDYLAEKTRRETLWHLEQAVIHADRVDFLMTCMENPRSCRPPKGWEGAIPVNYPSELRAALAAGESVEELCSALEKSRQSRRAPPPAAPAEAPAREPAGQVAPGRPGA